MKVSGSLMVALLLVVPFFFVSGPDWLATPVFRSVWNLGHVGFFAVLGVLLQRLTRERGLHLWLGSSLAVLLASVAIEYIQTHLGRDASWADVAHNLIGLWLGLVWAYPKRYALWLRLLFTALVVPGLAGVAVAVAVEVKQAWQFPQLAGFESSLERRRVSGRVWRSGEQASQGDYSLAMHFYPKGYSTIDLEVYRGDWSAYQTLAMDIYIPGKEPLRLTLRVNDRQHNRNGNAYNDRFNQSLVLAPGWNLLRFALADIANAPQGRRMDLSQITNVTLFSKDLPEGRRAYWDNVRLE